MWAVGFSINNLTLFGMVLAIGIVVDDAIVVVENVERWIEKGYTPREATYEAMHEVSGAVIAIAFGLSAVFIPVAFISGISGQFYRQFALTIAFSTLLPAVNSLTLSPALAALLLRPRDVRPDGLTRVMNFTIGWFLRLFNRGFEAMNHGYSRLLRRVVRLATVFLVVYAGLVGLVSGIQDRADGLHSAAGLGLSVRQFADARRGLARSHRARDGADVEVADVPGVEHTLAISACHPHCANQTNTGFVRAAWPFEEREHDPRQSATAIAQRSCRSSARSEGYALVVPPPPVRGIGTARFKIRGGSQRHRLLQQLQSVAKLTRARNDPRLMGLFPPRERAAALREPGPGEVKTQDVQVTDVFRRCRSISAASTSTISTFWQDVSRDGAGGCSVSGDGAGSEPTQDAQPLGGDGAARRRVEYQRYHRGGPHQSLQPLSVGGD